MNIIVDKLTYKYSPKTAFETTAVNNVSVKIDSGEFIGLIGRTGSGKSTFIQHLNGILKATSGNIYYNGEDIYDKDFDMSILRSKVGMVFQYPEHQLFETTVLADVKFGPKNLGLSDKEASIRAYEALELISFPRDLVEQSPFELSGGQKRLAAIAGVLAMKPEMLVLDEPTAGLDPKSKEEILKTLKMLQKDTGNTIILVSHNMDDVCEYAERVLMMQNGEIVFDGNTSEAFLRIEMIEAMGLKAPEITYLIRDLKKIGLDINIKSWDVNKATDEILKALKEKC